MNLSHVMVWDEEAELFRCRTGACSFKVTWMELKDAGYTPRKSGSMFVAAEDFIIETTS